MLIILCDMEFVFVVGGSYKAFYLNRLYKIGKPDIIIFHQNIFYDFDLDLEKDFNGPVSDELKYLNKLFNCPIVVYGVRGKCNKKNKCFIVCCNGEIKIFDPNSDIYIRVKDRYILIGSKRYFSSKTFATISICDSGQFYKINQRESNNYFCINKKNVMLIKGGKFYKKFNKCCKFIL